MQKNLIFAISVLNWVILSLAGAYFWSAIGIAITLYFTLRVIQQMGENIPIPDLMVAIASLQWIFGPFIEYHNAFSHNKYKMYVDEPTYMSFIVPGILLFKLGLSLFPITTNLEELSQRIKNLLSQHPNLPYYLISAGFIVPFLSGLFPSALGFVFFLLGNLKYIGVIYLLFTKGPRRWWIFFGTMVFTASMSIGIGLFHDLLLWAMLTFTFVAYEMRMKLIQKLSLALVGIFLAITIQSVKTDYRTIVWQGDYTGNKVTLFMGLAVDGWSTGSIVSPNSDEDMNVRLNQGWIISAIMHNIPINEPFANGSTITESMYASFVPRFLSPNKKMAGGRENFRKFTGLAISDNTSMGISLAGEGYANYGATGGIIFLFIWGMFIGWFWKKMENYSNLYPTLMIWTPIIFLQVIKAETEFAVVLNHLIKSSILVFGLLWAIKRYYRIRI